MRSLLLVVVVASASIAVALEGNSVRKLPTDPEINYTALELITSKGYPGEEHWVTTPDGYILGLHRISGPGPSVANRTNHTGPREVFFLQHGLLCASTNWLTNLANESLGFILADQGYDVWMGNVRGNTYSKNHTHLKTNTKEFWNFSFDEHAQIDLPTMLDYVMMVTGQKDLFYVGHSQGTVMGFAGFSYNQTLATHIKAFFALAPVTTVAHVQGAFEVISRFSTELNFVLSRVTDGEFIPNDFVIKFLAKEVCTQAMATEGLCGGIIFLICGFDIHNLNMSRVPIYYTHTPAGTSLKNVMHFSQETKSGRFAMFDYGSDALNKQKYGVSPSPPYNVSELKVPMALFSGGQDWLADPTDVKEMFPKINATGHVFYHKNIAYYDHLDFIWGLDAPNMVYEDIIKYASKMKSTGPGRS